MKARLTVRTDTTRPESKGFYLRGELDDARAWFGPFADKDACGNAFGTMKRRLNRWARRHGLSAASVAVGALECEYHDGTGLDAWFYL